MSSSGKIDIVDLSGNPMVSGREDSYSNGSSNGEYRGDGWGSLFTGYNDTSRDKRTTLTFKPLLLTKREAANLWRANDLASRVIEELPFDMFRKGYTFSMGEDKELEKDVVSFAEDLKVRSTFRRAKMFERAFGGSAIFPVMQDQQGDLSQPLNPSRVFEVEALHVFDPTELRPVEWYGDIRQPKFGEPSVYDLYPNTRGPQATRNYTGIKIHESRLIVFPGIRVERDQVSADEWGDSILCRVYEVLRDFDISWAGAAVLLQDFGFPEFKMKGLAELFALNQEDKIRARMRAIEMSRSTINTVLIDADGESYERKATSLAGYADLIKAFMLRLSAAARMPVTKLFGQSPAGLSATGESDISLWDDQVANEQDEIQPQLEGLYRVMLLSRNGPTRGKEPVNWSLKFLPLRQPTQEEESNTRKKHSETDKTYFDMGVLSAEEIVQSRFAGDKYGNDILVDMKKRRELEASDAEVSEAMMDPAILGLSSGTPVKIPELSQAITDIVLKVSSKLISRESGKGILMTLYRVEDDAAEAILGPEDFESALQNPSNSASFASDKINPDKLKKEGSGDEEDEGDSDSDPDKSGEERETDEDEESQDGKD